MREDMHLPKPEMDHHGIRIYRGDAITLLSRMPEHSVDGILTDPPYSSGGLHAADRQKSVTTKYVQTGTKRVLPEFAGDNRGQRSYQRWTVLWLAEYYRICKEGSVAMVFTDWRQLPLIPDAMQAAGFIYRGVVVWDKTEAARPFYGRFRHQSEYIVWGSKGKLALDNGKPALPGVFRMAVHGAKKVHIAQKPDLLIQSLLNITPDGGTILDPFLGSGTTAVAAKRMKRNCIGIEIDPHWCKTSIGRVKGTV